MHISIHMYGYYIKKYNNNMDKYVLRRGVSFEWPNWVFWWLKVHYARYIIIASKVPKSTVTYM